MLKRTFPFLTIESICCQLLLFVFLATPFSGMSTQKKQNENASVILKETHPYLFYTDDRVKELRKAIGQDLTIRDEWNKFLAMTSEVADKEGNSGIVDNLGLAYLMTGEEKYAKKMKEILFSYCERQQWEGNDLLKRDPSWHAGLGLARTTRTVAIGYDCIYDYLSPAERKLIVEALVNKGILPTLNDWLIGPQRIHSLDSMGHNWWSVCVYNAGIAVLAVLNDDPRAKGWLDEIMKSVPQWVGYQGTVLGHKPSNFDREGGFYESVHYASFAICEFLKFRLAYINTFPNSEFVSLPVLEHVDKFFIDACYPNNGALQSINFGDGILRVNDENPIMLLKANGFYKKNRDLWYLDQVRKGQAPKENRLGYDQSPQAFDLVYSLGINKEQVPDDPGLPLSALYPDMGWAMLRSSWNKNATLLAIKSGFTFNHAHADAGSFILYHNGKNLICDSGNSSYGDPEYTRYFCQSDAHNVVLFNGKGENPEDRATGSNNPGHLYSLLDAGDMKYIYANASSPYARYLMRNFRHFVWIGNTILVIDDLKSYESGQFEWLLHYEGTPEVKGTDIKIVDGNASVVVRPLFPGTLENTGKLKLHVKEGPSPRNSQPPIPFYSILNPIPERVTKFVTAILLPDKDHPEKLPEIETFEGKNMLGVKITEGDKVTYVYYNLMADGRIMHEPSHNVFDGWETDATMVAMTYAANGNQQDPDDVIDYLVVDGSYLRKNGKMAFSSLSKIFMITRNEGSVLNISLDGQPVVDLRLRTSKRPIKTLLDNQPVKVEFDEFTNMIKLVKMDK